MEAKDSSKEQSSVSLVEIVLVIVIIGILCSVAIPRILSAVDASRRASDMAVVADIYMATTDWVDEQDSSSLVSTFIDVTSMDQNDSNLAQTLVAALTEDDLTPSSTKSIKGIKPEHYFVSIDEDGEVIIYVGPSDATASDSCVELYPNVPDEYSTSGI